MPPTLPALKFVRPLEDDVGAIFRSWALLERFFRVLLRLLWLLAGFSASWCAPGSIFEGFGALRGWFWKPHGLVFRGFRVDAGMHC